MFTAKLVTEKVFDKLGSGYDGPRATIAGMQVLDSLG
jgi:hypothetical protein